MNLLNASTNPQAFELLRESLNRKFVQEGYVSSIKTLRPQGGKPVEVVEIKFLGISVFCKMDDFTKRKISSLSGFLDTPVPFIVKDINIETGIVEVSRVEALPIIAGRFLSKVKEGDIVHGVVSGVINDKNIVYVDINGFPAMVPPGEWAMHQIVNLREMVPIGTEVEVKVTNIVDAKDDEDWEWDIKLRVSRRALLKEERDLKWQIIDTIHTPDERVVAKIVAKAPGKNSYLIQVVSSGIVIIGNLQKPLSEQYRYSNLPQGLTVQAVIQSLDKENQRGKARIFRLNPTANQAGGRYGSF